VHVNDLLLEERQWAEHDVLSLTPHVFEVFEGGEMMPDLPDDVGEEKRQRDRGSGLLLGALECQHKSQGELALCSACDR
jgi:hypothetical protein